MLHDPNKGHDLRQAEAVLAWEDNLSFMSKLPNGSMKLIVTSPPYNIGKAYERRSSLQRYVAAQEAAIAESSACFIRVVQFAGRLGTMSRTVRFFRSISFSTVLQRHGLRLRNRIIWHFEHGLHCSKRLSGRHETILWFTKGDAYTFNLDPIRVASKYPNKRFFKGPRRGQLSGNPLGKNPGDVWIFPNVKNNHVEKTIHPCQFPVELVERLVLSLTNPGDSILDPYMGVGSSIIAAVKQGRSGYGCDIVREYVQIARERLRRLRAGSLRTRPMNRPVYDPSLPHGGHR